MKELREIHKEMAKRLTAGDAVSPFSWHVLLKKDNNRNTMMSERIVTIDIDRLREDLRDDDLGAFYGGGFGGALLESFDIDRATPEELVQIAQNRGIDLRRYMMD